MYIFVFEPFAGEKAVRARVGALIAVTPEESHLVESWGFIKKELIK